MAATKISLKLVINKTTHKVLFAEAGKDFVDFVFNILSLPVAVVIKVLAKESMVGCIGNLYQSVEILNEAYFKPNRNKDSLLKPRVPTTSTTTVPRLLPDDAVSPPFRNLYSCGYHDYVSENIRTPCPYCGSSMRTEVQYIEADKANAEGGYVKELVMYMVKDDLVVMPLSVISAIEVLNKLGVRESQVLEEKVVDFGINEGLKLLEASLRSKAALSYAFLGKGDSKDATKKSEDVAEKSLNHGDSLGELENESSESECEAQNSNLNPGVGEAQL